MYTGICREYKVVNTREKLSRMPKQGGNNTWWALKERLRQIPSVNTGEIPTNNIVKMN